MELRERIEKAVSYSGLNQSEIARRCGVRPSAVNQWITGQTKAPKAEQLWLLAKASGVSLDWLIMERGLMIPDGNQLLAHEDESINTEYAFVPVLSAKAAAGDGYENHHVEEQGTLAFRREWMKRQHLKEENLKLIRADGESMQPHINDGDMLLLDMRDTEAHSGNVYAIRRPDYSISVKRLSQSFSGDWLIVSDNPDKTRFRDEPIGDIAASNIPIVGKVVWRGGLM